MFDVGFWELALIGAVALIIIGPERLPGAAHTAGLWVGKGRRMLRDVKADIDRELREQNVADLAALKKDFQSAGDEIKKTADEVGEAAAVEGEVKDAAESLKAAFEEASPHAASKAESTGGKIRETKSGAAKKTMRKKSRVVKKPAKKTTKKTAKKTAKKTTRKKSGGVKKSAKKTTKKSAKKTAKKSTRGKVASR